jgi:hypothetical protein
LKYSQLIQILSINPQGLVCRKFADSIDVPINQLCPARKLGRGVTGDGDAGAGRPATAAAGRAALYAALTLSCGIAKAAGVGASEDRPWQRRNSRASLPENRGGIDVAVVLERCAGGDAGRWRAGAIEN